MVAALKRTTFDHAEFEHVSQQISNFVYIHGVCRPLFGGKSRAEVMGLHQQIMMSAAEEWIVDSGNACLAAEAEQKQADKTAAHSDAVVQLDAATEQCLTPGTAPDELPIALLASTGPDQPNLKWPFTKKPNDTQTQVERHTTPEAVVEFFDKCKNKKALDEATKLETKALDKAINKSEKAKGSKEAKQSKDNATELERPINIITFRQCKTSRMVYLWPLTRQRRNRRSRKQAQRQKQTNQVQAKIKAARRSLKRR